MSNCYSCFILFRTLRFQKLLAFGRPGNPGAKFKGPYEKMIKAWTLPKTVKEELGINDDATGDNFIVQNKASKIEVEGDQEEKKATIDEAAQIKQLLSDGR